MRSPHGWTRLVLVAATVAVAAVGACAGSAGAHRADAAAGPVAHRSTVVPAAAHPRPAPATRVQLACFLPDTPTVLAAVTRVPSVRRSATTVRTGRRRHCGPPLTLTISALVGRVPPVGGASALRRGTSHYAPVDTS
jgi:hypothetical protein